jgi:multicomponent Na+:H+ antiporter subunit A
LIQNGSLRFYTSVSVLTAVVLAGYVLIDNQLFMMPEMDPVRPLDYAVLALLILSTLVMAFANSRLGTVAALSGVGVGAALFFLLYSAPDLALTQFLVDTLAVVMLVLAFRHLREYGPRRPAITRAVRWVIALSFGAMVTVGVLIAQAVEPLRKVSESHQAKSVPEAYGQNIVNVILVDFRAFDTMGEITVLGIAAAGVIILLRKVRRGGGPPASASNVFNKVENSSK